MTIGPRVTYDYGSDDHDRWAISADKGLTQVQIAAIEDRCFVRLSVCLSVCSVCSVCLVCLVCLVCSVRVEDTACEVAFYPVSDRWLCFFCSVYVAPSPSAVRGVKTKGSGDVAACAVAVPASPAEPSCAPTSQSDPSNAEAEAADDACGVCLESFVAQQIIKVLRCHHRFHTVCASEVHIDAAFLFW